MKNRFFIIIVFLFSGILLMGQDDCVTAVSLSLGSPLSTSNVGSTPDVDYSSQTGCPSSSYTSTVWYSFTTTATMSSINLTYTAGTIGPSSVLTIVDDCSSAVNNFMEVSSYEHINSC